MILPIHIAVKRGGVTNLVAALLSIYFVGTALTTVRAPSRWTRAINVAALTLAIGLALAAIAGGIRNIGSDGLSPGGVPLRTIGFMSFVLATALSLAAIGDVRVWRMCFALSIAAGSFFSIRERVAKILPEPFTTGTMRMLPILLIFGSMFYWMRRVEAHQR